MVLHHFCTSIFYCHFGCKEHCCTWFYLSLIVLIIAISFVLSIAIIKICKYKKYALCEQLKHDANESAKKYSYEKELLALQFEEKEKTFERKIREYNDITAPYEELKHKLDM